MSSLFETVLGLSLGATVTALLVLFARALLGRKPGILMPLLYALVVIRLILPVTVESPLSLQNLVSDMKIQQNVQPNDIASGGPVQEASTADAITDAAGEETNAAVSAGINTTGPSANITIDQEIGDVVTETMPVWAPSLIEIASLVWAAGMAVIALSVLASNIRFMHMLRSNRAYDAPEFRALLDECKRCLHITTQIHAIRASEVNTAAVYGIIRPKLLISPQAFESLSEADKKHVLLHELSHIKCGDTAVCLLLTIISIVHWFNPAIWIMLGLMRRDIEVFCDARVMKVLSEEGRFGYAQTLVHMAEPTANKSRRLIAAMFICKANTKRRIVMISKYRKNKAIYTALALLLAAMIAVTGCTAAVDTAESVVPDTTAVESATPTQPVEAEDTVTNEVDRTAGLISTYSLDCSDYALSEARLSNINKAVSILDGTIIPYDEQFEFMDTLGNISEESGWQTAPGYGWEWVTSEFDVEENSSANSEMIDQAGGGIELVVLAIASAAGDNLDCGFTWDDEVEGYLNIGDYGIKNNQYSDGVVIYTSFEGSRITINICSIGLAQAQAVKATSDIIATYSIDNSQFNNPSRMFNIEKAAGMLNNTVIHPGEAISLNEILGTRTEATGWKAAAGIENGGYISVYGGGVHALSNALYNAAIRAELTIESFTHHDFPSGEVPGGLDATIGNGGPDLVISNSYDTDIMIEAYIDGLILTVNIYGPPLGYTLDFTSKYVEVEGEPEYEYIYNTAKAPDGTVIAAGESYVYSVYRGSKTFVIYKTYYNTDGSEIKTEEYATYTYPAIPGITYVNGPQPG